MKLEYEAIINGGNGIDVWTKTISFTANDFLEAAQIAQHNAEQMNGQVVLLDQIE